VQSKNPSLHVNRGISDDSILKEVGKRLTHQRIRLNQTQKELAFNAGISERTLERCESGGNVTMSVFLKILRALDIINLFDVVVPIIQTSPISLLKDKAWD